ncbi:MAG: cytochrome c [Burkholderiales bacterium]|nr:cytochrome c [Burkholderiales bacterium]
MRRRSAAARVAAALALAALPAAGAADRPQGAGAQVARGAALYEAHCAVCHGQNGRGGQGFPRPIWGPGHDLRKFATAQGLFEYLQLTMPFDDPQKLNDAEKLAVVAFLLARNAAIREDGEITPANAATIRVAP